LLVGKVECCRRTCKAVLWQQVGHGLGWCSAVHAAGGSMLIDGYTKCAVGWSHVAAHCLVENSVVAYISKAWGFI
jgi:hypothetical protein